MPDTFQFNQQYGGTNSPTGLPSIIGALRNDISGTTAANRFNALEAEKSRQFNATEAQKARDFELYMSNSAYSRAVEDMRKAGVNPASLTGVFSSGSAASTGSGSAATSSPASSSSSKASGVVGQLLKLAVGMALFS